MSQFDADALERAAKAARELEGSKNLKALLELSKRESDVKKAVQETKTAEANAARAGHAKEQESIRWAEQRKTVEHNKQMQMEMEEYKAKLAIDRLEAENQKARQRNRELVQMQTDAEAKKEALRRATEEEILAQRRKSDEHRAALERQNMEARALAEAEGRIREKRENEDVFLRQIAAKGEEARKHTREGIETFFRSLGDSLASFVTDKSKLTTTVISLTALAAGIYSTREGARLVGRFIERRLGTPSLVRETSKTAAHFSLANTVKRIVGMQKDEGFKDVVLYSDMDARVNQLCVSSRNTKRHAAPFRHVMFYGPPGTGKTMVAKKLAKSAGLDYAIMTGGDVGPLGADGVTQLHKLFDWSESSSRGLLLFIDEADAFLGKRSRSGMSENQRNALNALLYRTGEASRNFMMVLATNRPEDLDSAVTDRVDESMHFQLPNKALRRRLLEQYFDKYVRHAGEDARVGPLGLLKRPSAAIKVDPEGFTNEFWEELSELTEGFSGRGISKLMLAVQATAYGRREALVTVGVVRETVAWKLDEFRDAKSGFANLTDAAAHITAGAGAGAGAADLVQQHLQSAAYVPKA